MLILAFLCFSITQVVVKHAQYVAQAVARSQYSLSSWTCMGARRRPVGTTAKEKSSDLDSPSETNLGTTIVDCSNHLDDPHSDSSQDSDNEETEEDELTQRDKIVNVSAVEELTGDLWFDLEKELNRAETTTAEAQQEVEAAVKEIIDEENAVLQAEKQHSTIVATETLQFYPPGKIMHMVLLPTSDPEADQTEHILPDEHNVGIYETPRYLYSKIRLSRTMINDHYMPMYKKIMELLIDKLAKDQEDDHRDTLLS